MRQGKSFGSIAFTDAVKALQEKAGSRASYARMEKNSYVDGLTIFPIYSTVAVQLGF
jgi:hypothetical protein